MKLKTFTLIATMFAVGTILNGCNTQAEKVDDANQKVQDEEVKVSDADKSLAEARKDLITEFEKFKNESNLIIENNEQHIADLRIDLKNQKAEAKENYQRDVDALERKNRDLRRKLADYNDDGKSDWKKFKRGFNHDLDALGDDFKNFSVNVTK